MPRAKVTATELNVRSGPDPTYRRVAGLTKGAVVEILEKAPDGGVWVWVEPGAGWVSGEYLAAVAAPWRVASALDKLRAQVDAAFPGRNKKSDGTIGDTSHQAGPSDHNPIPAPAGAADDREVVTAQDLTHDPKKRADMHKVVAALVASQDSRIKYIIFDGQMWRSYDRPKGKRPFLPAWKPEPYTAANKHRTHMHISVRADPRLYDDTRPWSIGA